MPSKKKSSSPRRKSSAKRSRKPESRKRYYAKIVHGNLAKTPGGLTKKDIKKSKGKYTSVKKSQHAKKVFNPWLNALAKAKKELGISKHDFVLINKGALGKELYKKAKDIYY